MADSIKPTESTSHDVYYTKVLEDLKNLELKLEGYFIFCMLFLGNNIRLYTMDSFFFSCFTVR